MKKLTNIDNILEELKVSDPESYKEIIEHTAKAAKEWGGQRTNAGRKPKTGTVLNFSKRITQKEGKFIDYAREHNIDLDDLMQG